MTDALEFDSKMDSYGTTLSVRAKGVLPTGAAWVKATYFSTEALGLGISHGQAKIFVKYAKRSLRKAFDRDCKLFQVVSIAVK